MTARPFSGGASTLRCPALLALALAQLTTAGCSAPGGPDAVRDPRFHPGLADAAAGPRGGAGSSDGPEPAVLARCVPSRAEPLPARADVLSEASTTSPERVVTMLASDLFGLFRSHCGACHAGAASLGGFQVSPATFASRVDAKVLAVIRSDDPAKVMPKPENGGKPFSQRAPGDPVVELARLLELWIQQGRKDEFTIARESVATVADSYRMTAEAGRRLTSLGDCIPERGLVGEAAPRMEELDSRFASATELPATLAETDLVTLDGEALARQGVIAFAPAYPLWADDAAKIRHIRVPRGTSVRFDKEKQEFDIPANTRFYKTFLKRVVDRQGNASYRKIETRLILSRPDKQDPGGGRAPAEVTALFGTYLWNDDETEARLLADPLRNGEPFRDRVLTYFTDEPRLEEVRASKPRNLTFTLENEHPGLMRRYAVPGSQRCLECHMGSPSASFVLGFTPLQIARRPEGEGGILEPPREDELNQLQRLIAYGLITGIESPTEVLPLERSQGERQPRNEHELRAQGYMLGACANCHNPRGFPSIKSPELAPVLDMWPTRSGGIFQFPLDRVSPLRRRGFNQDVPLPYITPSLREYPVAALPTPNWTPKWVDCNDALPWQGCARRPGERFVHVDAPWRSLLYRNVDTPYSYVDDFVVFPRMPMHGPGFDCRLPRLMGDWMVSIPSAPKRADIEEDAVPGRNKPVNTEPQPYEEVKPGEPGYDAAVAEAARRLDAYHAGGRYQHCHDTSDIVDRAIKGNKGDPLVPVANEVFGTGEEQGKLLMPNLRIPVRPHWVITDLTDPAGEWNPRRADWAKLLVDGAVSKDTSGRSPEQAESLLRERTMVKEVLETVTITQELRSFALGEQPFGLWQSRPECESKLANAARVSSFQGASRPRWMDTSKAPAGAAVYTQSPGEAVYGTICFNCHGPRADSKGLMSEAIMLMTGGEARVANFRDGLFGPPERPGANRQRVFGTPVRAGVTADDMAARYLAWMALGGTEQLLPESILNIVATTRVLGESRPGNKIDPEGSPNMLALARQLCAHTLPAFGGESVELDLSLRTGSIVDFPARTGLIDSNFDAEMWQRLCAIGNRQVVRVPYVNWNADHPRPGIAATESLYFAEGYPANAEVMDQAGKVHRGVRPDNLFPLCVRTPSASDRGKADKFLADNPVGGSGGARIPYCPPELFASAPPGPDDPPGTLREKWKLRSEFRPGSTDLLHDVQRWSTRGAANAGVAVFLYLDQLQRGTVKPRPTFDKCQDLP